MDDALEIVVNVSGEPLSDLHFCHKKNGLQIDNFRPVLMIHLQTVQMRIPKRCIHHPLQEFSL